jgi:hypothetical protein
MKFLIILLLGLNATLLFSQDCEELTNSELKTLEKLVIDDVRNWPQNIPDSLTSLIWKVFPLFECKHEIVLKTDSGDYQFDLIEEVRKRTFGGFAGSYPHAESWNFELNENELIDKVKALLKENPELTSKDFEFPLEKESYWLHINIQRPNTKETIYFWIRESSIALVSYTNSLNGERKYINHDFWFGENNLRIKAFEEIIVNGIKS